MDSIRFELARHPWWRPEIEAGLMPYITDRRLAALIARAEGSETDDPTSEYAGLAPDEVVGALLEPLDVTAARRVVVLSCAACRIPDCCGASVEVLAEG